ncbi:unnamed protein product [Rhizophagus irregularis]|nr:unnamed protein product [Rhizophagus irregularis]CAB5378463.1 unnamed protein product [Rhizophagus irregularis]
MKDMTARSYIESFIYLASNLPRSDQILVKAHILIALIETSSRFLFRSNNQFCIGKARLLKLEEHLITIVSSSSTSTVHNIRIGNYVSTN